MASINTLWRGWIDYRPRMKWCSPQHTKVWKWSFYLTWRSMHTLIYKKDTMYYQILFNVLNNMTFIYVDINVAIQEGNNAKHTRSIWALGLAIIWFICLILPINVFFDHTIVFIYHKYLFIYIYIQYRFDPSSRIIHTREWISSRNDCMWMDIIWNELYVHWIDCNIRYK